MMSNFCGCCWEGGRAERRRGEQSWPQMWPQASVGGWGEEGEVEEKKLVERLLWMFDLMLSIRSWSGYSEMTTDLAPK